MTHSDSSTGARLAVGDLRRPWLLASLFDHPLRIAGVIAAIGVVAIWLVAGTEKTQMQPTTLEAPITAPVAAVGTPVPVAGNQLPMLAGVDRPASPPSVPIKLGGAATTAVAVVEPVPVQISANAWAVVYVDDVEVGRLPSAKAIMMTPGERRLRLESPLIETLATKVVVRKDGSNRLRFRLQPKTTERVISLGKAGRLTVNGVDYGVVEKRAMRMSFGTHEIKVKRDGESARTGTITIGPETPVEIRIE